MYVNIDNIIHNKNVILTNDDQSKSSPGQCHTQPVAVGNNPQTVPDPLCVCLNKSLVLNLIQDLGSHHGQNHKISLTTCMLLAEREKYSASWRCNGY